MKASSFLKSKLHKRIFELDFNLQPFETQITVFQAKLLSLSHRIEQLLKLVISLGLCAGFYYVARYKSPPGKVFLLGKNVLSLGALAAWCGLLGFWIFWIVSLSKKISIRWRAALYALLLIESLPYLYSFGINWPYEWPQQSRQDIPHHEWCYPGYVFLPKEFNVCGKQNSEGRWDLEYSKTPAPGVYRAAYLGNSHVEAQSIPLMKKASKIAQTRLNERGREHPRAEIMDLYYSAMPATGVLSITRGLTDERQVKHIVLKSMGVELELPKVSDPTQQAPVGLYQNAFLQRLIHVPASNLAAFLAWNGLRLYIELYNPSLASASGEQPPADALKNWIQNECGLVNPKMIHHLAVYSQGILRSYQGMKSVDRGGKKMTILQMPFREPLVSSPSAFLKYQDCLIKIHDTRFKEVFTDDPAVNLADITRAMRREQIHPSQIYFPADHHLNELGNRLVGETMAEGLAWSF